MNGFKLTTLVVIGTDCTGSCKSNFYTITTTTAPEMKPKISITPQYLHMVCTLKGDNSTRVALITVKIKFNMYIFDIIINRNHAKKKILVLNKAKTISVVHFQGTQL